MELGGTKTVVLLAQGSAILNRRVIATTTPSETLHTAREVLSAWADHPGFSALGIGAFGPLQLDRSSPAFGRLFATPKPGWTSADVAGELTRGLACPWGIDTDVNAAALAEMRWGAGRDCEDLCYITVGTGIGGGLVLRRRPVHGLMHPELGHLRLRREPGDRFPGTCPFHTDCVEGLASGSALHQRFGKNPADVGDDDPQWKFVAATLAELVTNVLLTVSVRRIIFGGTVMLKRPNLLQSIRRGAVSRISGYLPAVDAASIERIVRPAGLGGDAGPLGSVAVGLLSLEPNHIAD